MREATGITLTNVYRRRARMAKDGLVLPTNAANAGGAVISEAHWGELATPWPEMAREEVRGGCVVVFGDAHYWGEPPFAHEAMLKLLPRLKPQLIIANGDVFDGATISRHDPLGWQKLPTVRQELDFVKTRLAEVERAAPKARKLKTVGNHDSRFDRRLATDAAQFQDVQGFRITDHIKWPMSYAVLINEDTDPVFVVHNVRNGIHATWNNVKSTGCTTVTGHLHDQNERPQTFLLREASGIDHGCLADTDGPQFSYRMGRPSNWRSGFVVLTFDKQGRMLPAEFCRVQRFKGYRRAVFRGEVIAERKS